MVKSLWYALAILALSGCGDGRSSGPTGAPSVGEIKCKSLPQSIGNTTTTIVNVDCGDDVAVVPPVVVTGAE